MPSLKPRFVFGVLHSYVLLLFSWFYLARPIDLDIHPCQGMLDSLPPAMEDSVLGYLGVI